MRVELDAALEPLVAAAVRGEDVELTRGGEVVAAVVRRTAFADLAGREVDLVRLRTPDAIHLAIAERIGAPLLGFDDDQNAAAAIFGMSLAAVGDP